MPASPCDGTIWPVTHDYYIPLSPAPDEGLFEELNVFGTPTGVVAFVTGGEALPGAPRGFTWRSIKTLSVKQLQARAAELRTMAAGATTVQAVNGLLKLAERFDALAIKREREKR